MKKAITISSVLSVFFIIPFLFTNGALVGDDLSFHLNRMLSLENVWESPINFKYFYGIGSSVNLFYPFLTYYPFYIFYKFTGSIYWGFIIFQILLANLTFLISYYSASTIFNSGVHKSNNSHFYALIFAILYTFSNYRLDNIINRFATGEYLAQTFIPLVFMGLYVLLVYETSNKHYYFLPIGISLIVYSHILSFVITAILVGTIFFSVIFFTNDRVVRGWNFVKSILIAILLSSFQLIIMLEQFFSNKIMSPSIYSLNDSTKPFTDLFAISGAISHNHLGIMIVFSFTFLVIFAFLRKIDKLEFYLLIISLLLILLQSDFTHYPDTSKLLGIIQFIWRLESFVTLFVLFAISHLLYRIKLKKVSTIVIVVLLSITIPNMVISLNNRVDTGIDTLNYMINDDNSDKVINGVHKASDYIIHSSTDKQSLEGFQEKINHKVFIENSSEEIPSKLKFDKNYSVINVYVDKLKENIEIPFYLFKGVIVRVDGEVQITRMSNKGAPVVEVNQGEHEIIISYQKTWFYRISAIISILSTLILLVYLGITHFYRISELK
ncbi:TPA: hypothetical protein U2B30_001782 [Streptococcus suis]|nr:hypothetical protein [Streptococcus suis]